MPYNIWFNNGLNKSCTHLDMNPSYKYTFMRSNLLGTNIFRPPLGGATLVGFLIKHNVILARHLYLLILLNLMTNCKPDTLFQIHIYI